MTGFEFIFRRRVPSIAMKNGHAGQMNQVKGCVSRGFNHTTFDHVFWPAEYDYTRTSRQYASVEVLGLHL